jgi:alpha-tubulin suppressor-like RCC1 family protein
MRRLRDATLALGAAALLLVPAAPAVRALPPPPPIVAIAAGSGFGGGHTCALTSSGGAKCWGANNDGQLGDGTTISRTVPADVSGLTSGVTQIAAGENHTCALTVAGGVKCWGSNDSGQLGDGTAWDRLTPVDVVGLASGVTAISTSFGHTCALTDGGGAKCWGSGSTGELGDGRTKDSRIPIDVSGLASGVTAIAAGGGYTCAIVSGGALKCWGAGSDGELGDGSTSGSLTPVGVTGLEAGVMALAAGFWSACAVAAGGAVKCWGYNADGQLGDGTTTDAASPVAVSGLASGATAVSVGLHHSCALTAGGGVMCWGGDLYGQLGDGTTTDSLTPVAVSGLASGATAIATGSFHSCALTAGHVVKCWGVNASGALGTGTTDSSVPVDVDFSLQSVALASSKEPGTLARGSSATFTARVSPRSPVGTPMVVRFVVYRRVGSAWRLAAERDVTADAYGRARLRWTFSKAGAWYVRASARENASYAASGWSELFRYSVR